MTENESLQKETAKRKIFLGEKEMTESDVLPYVGKWIKVTYSPANAVAVYPPPQPLVYTGKVIDVNDTQLIISNYVQDPRVLTPAPAPVIINLSDIVKIEDPTVAGTTTATTVPTTQASLLGMSPWVLLALGAGALWYFNREGQSE